MKQFIILAIVLIAGCSPQKRMGKAIERVLSSDTATNHVGKVWEATHPCTNDTVIQAGDSLITPIFIEAAIDIDSLKAALSKALPADTVIKYKILAPCKCPPLKTVYITDNRKLELARDSISDYMHLYAVAKDVADGAFDKVEELSTKLANKDRECNKQIWKVRLHYGLPLLLLLLLIVFKKRLEKVTIIGSIIKFFL